MKKFLSIIFSAAFLYLLTACSDPCKKLKCGANSDCIPEEETCSCHIGYEKDSVGQCSIISRKKFVGNWAGVLMRDTVPDSTYTLVIDTENIQDIPSVRLNNVFPRWLCNQRKDSVSVLAKVSYNSLSYKLIDFKMNTICADSLELLNASAEIVDKRLKINYKFRYIDPVDSLYKFTTFSGDLEKQ